MTLERGMASEQRFRRVDARLYHAFCVTGKCLEKPHRALSPRDFATVVHCTHIRAGLEQHTQALHVAGSRHPSPRGHAHHSGIDACTRIMQFAHTNS